MSHKFMLAAVVYAMLSSLAIIALAVNLIQLDNEVAVLKDRVLLVKIAAGE